MNVGQWIHLRVAAVASEKLIRPVSYLYHQLLPTTIIHCISRDPPRLMCYELLQMRALQGHILRLVCFRPGKGCRCCRHEHWSSPGWPSRTGESTDGVQSEHRIALQTCRGLCRQ
jgi:hypothetical protein